MCEVLTAVRLARHTSQTVCFLLIMFRMRFLSWMQSNYFVYRKSFFRSLKSIDFSEIQTI